MAQVNDVAGKWYRSTLNQCNVFSVLYTDNVTFQGECVGGLANGKGTITLYRDGDLRDVYEAYFLNGLYIAATPVPGVVMRAPNNQFYYHYNPGNARIKFYSNITPRGRLSAACQNVLFASTGSAITSPDMLKAVADSGLALKSKLCTPFGKNGTIRSITVRLVPDGFFSLPTFQEQGNAKALWNGQTWVVNEATAAGVRKTYSASATIQQPPINQPTQPATASALALSVQVARKMNVGYPTCEVSLSLTNISKAPIGAVTIAGVAKASNNVEVGRFVADRTSGLQAGAKAVLRRTLPSTACGYISQVQIQQMRCTVNNQITDACKTITQLAQEPLAADAMKNVRVVF